MGKPQVKQTKAKAGRNYFYRLFLLGTTFTYHSVLSVLIVQCSLNDNNNMEFGKILKQLRIEKGMTQKELAIKLNVTDSAVRCWESFGREPNYATLINLAQIFAVTVGQLLGTEEY